MHNQDNQADSLADQTPSGSLDIAVVGMAGRFPGANSMEEFWSNLKHGVESIRFYSEEEVIASGVAPEMARDPNFVPAAGGIDHEFDFDAEFFDFTPREAEILDPQQRIALESAWEALESAACNPETYQGRIGVIAGVSLNTYLLFNLAPNAHLVNSVGQFPMMTANDKDFLATRISYKLNLKGPALSVQTACSTGLVAVNLACQSLLNYQSDMVLAGGVSITPKGRLYKDSFIFSKDGRCRAFDADAQGTVGGNGVGLVVLKRLDDAIANGDHIHAVIKGSAINNDGSLKVGYTAPSVEGQVDVILEAQAMAGVDPDTITYIEAHGTGTLLGDPIEVSALTQAFRKSTPRKQYCAIGSVKTNVGHLDTAAGVSGLMKAILAVEHKQIPPSLHYTKPNPKLDIENTPFFVNTELRDWETHGMPRRAGISSFGFGGTNAHTIIEQAPARGPSAPSRAQQLLVVSGRNDAAVKGNIERLGRYLAEHPELPLADVAYTLQVGRKAFKRRATLVATDTADAAKALGTLDAKRITFATPRDVEPAVVFMFSGQGSQYLNMARELYETEPAFSAAFDNVAAAMRESLGCELHSIVYPVAGEEALSEELLKQTRYTQPALFAVEYALARLWQSLGVQPKAMIGHSIGEYVAATLAGVFTMADAARLVCVRGQLVQAQPEGAMLSVPLSEADVRAVLNSDLSLAAVNAPELCTVAGPHAAIDALQQLLTQRGVNCKRLVVSHAFHSHMLDEAARGLQEAVASVAMQPPAMPYLSNVSGTWVTAEQATSPAYWAEHLRQAVRFSDGLVTLLADKPAVLLEVGPGQSLTTLARQHRTQLEGAVVVSSTRHPLVEGSDVAQALGALGQLWQAGVDIDWQAFHHHGPRRRVPLPTYAFQRKRYWIPPIFGQATLQLPAAGEAAAPVQQVTHHVAHEADSPDYLGPRDDIERTIAGVWEGMLGIGRIGMEDDFFRLGGHSLLATQLVAELRRLTDTEITVQSLFKTPTIAGLAAEVRALRAANPNFQAATIPRIPREGKLPLSYHQEMVWDFERRWGGTSRFNGCLSIKLVGELDMKALHFGVNEILRRHEVLRTNYRHVNGVNEAVIQPFAPVEVPVRDFSDSPPATRERQMLEVAIALARQPFDLTTDQCIRPVLVKLAAQEHMLLISSHYVAVDGWTIGLVIQEFATHYAASLNPDAPRLPEIPFQCVDYAAWQRQQLNDEVIKTNMVYWRQQLANLAPQYSIPPDRMRTLRPSMRGSSYHFSVGKEISDAIKQFAHDEGYTTFMTFTAALNALYHAYSGAKDIVVGTMTGDREIGTEAMVGALVNMLALRTQVDPSQSFRQLLDSVRQTSVDAFAHPVPFMKLAEGLNRNLFRQPLFRNVFILRNVPYTEAKAGDLDVVLNYLPLDRGVSDADITLYLQDRQGAFSGYFEYSVDLFDRSTIEQLMQHFVALLRDMLAQPDAPLSTMLPKPAKRPIHGSMVQRLMSMVGLTEAA